MTERMSGNTSETRCKHERKEYISGNTYCEDCKIWMNAGRPPEGEAVPEQAEEFEMHITPRSVTRIPIPPAPVVSAPDMTAAEHLKQCCACNHGRTPCIEYQRNWPVVSTVAPEPSKRDRAIPRTVSLVTCANCDAQVPPAAAGCIRCGASLMIKNSASEEPLRKLANWLEGQ